jgi:outer membrane protein assembly factor BamE (lipoprotein component of BamABCDE complex)
MLSTPRTVLVLAVAAVSAALAGCSTRSTAAIQQGDTSIEEMPEPPTPGVTPLTQEQEEMISQ